MFQFSPLTPKLDLKTELSPQRESACDTINLNKFYSKNLIFDRTHSSKVLVKSRKGLAQTIAQVSLIWGRQNAIFPSTNAASRLEFVSIVRVNYQDKSILKYRNSCFFPLWSTLEDYSKAESCEMIRSDRIEEREELTKLSPYAEFKSHCSPTIEYVGKNSNPMKN